MDKKQRVSFYVDGFNLYYGLRDKGWRKYLWLDVVAFCSLFLRPHQELIEANYFTAIPKDRGKHDRHDIFLSANKQNPQFKLSLGKYLEKKKTVGGNLITTYEEKQTDVNIAVKMIRDIVFNLCDISIIISADSDLTPPIDFIREYKPSHKIFVYFPPNRFSYDLKQKVGTVLLLDNYEDRFRDAQLPNPITLPNGHILERPTKWQ